MNAYIKKLMTYQSLKQLHQQGFSIAKISSITGINWRTIKSYLSMNVDEFNQFIESKSQRRRGLLPYESFVRTRLEKYPDTPAAQMHDWLKESFPEFPQTATRTLFNFVIWVRQKYTLPQIKPSREYEMVEETAYGSQAQADFGVYNLRNGMGKRVNVFLLLFNCRGPAISMSGLVISTLPLSWPLRAMSRPLRSFRVYLNKSFMTSTGFL